jgi:hypothetical protein
MVTFISDQYCHYLPAQLEGAADKTKPLTNWKCGNVHFESQLSTHHFLTPVQNCSLRENHGKENENDCVLNHYIMIKLVRSLLYSFLEL